MWTRPITVAETAVFMRQAAGIWSEDDRSSFIDFIARNPEVGDLIPQTGGVRKVRWSRQGMGKRGGGSFLAGFLADFVVVFFAGIVPPV